MSGGIRHIRIRDRFFRIVAVIIDRHIDQRKGAARRDAEDRPRRCDRQTLARARKAPREHKTDGDLAHDLEDLGDGRRLHVAHALRIAAVRARQIHEHERRRQRPDALCCADIVEHPGQLRREQEHDQAEQQAENGKRQPGHAEDLARLHGAAERVRLADHARERDRHTRRGHVEKDIINIIGNGEIAVSLVAENIAERDLIDRAEDLDDHNASRHHGRAVEIVLLAAFLQTALPPPLKFHVPVYFTLPDRKNQGNAAHSPDLRFVFPITPCARSRCGASGRASCSRSPTRCHTTP